MTMKTLFKSLLFLAVLMGVLAVVGGFAALHGLHHQPDMSIVVDGEELVWEGGLGDWLGAGVGLFVAGVVVCLVVPFALLVGVALPLLIVGGVLGVVFLSLFGVGAVLGSPVIILGLVIYLMLRNKRRTRMAAGQANAARSLTRVEPD